MQASFRRNDDGGRNDNFITPKKNARNRAYQKRL